MKKLSESRLTFLPLYMVFIPLFGFAGIEKFYRGVPDWFVKQFQNTVLDSFTGQMATSFYFIATLEITSALFFVASVARLEFLPARKVSFLRAGLLLSMFTFAVLGFGLRLTHDFNGAFQLFGYFTLTFLLHQSCGRLAPPLSRSLN